jgi:hypothetical protein
MLLASRKNKISFTHWSTPADVFSVLGCYTVSTVNFWHRSFKFNSNKSLTWCNSFLVYYPIVCLQLNVFQALSRTSSGAQWLQWQPLVLPSYRGDSRAVFVVWPAGRQAGPTMNTTRLSPRYKGKTRIWHSVIELLMMDGKTRETCWAVNKRQHNKLKNFCIRLVIFFLIVRWCMDLKSLHFTFKF